MIPGPYRTCQYCDTLMPANAFDKNRAGYFGRAEIQCFNRMLAKYQKWDAVMCEEPKL